MTTQANDPNAEPPVVETDTPDAQQASVDAPPESDPGAETETDEGSDTVPDVGDPQAEAQLDVLP